MPTVSTKISKKEHDAIVEYANACGETVSNLVRKAMIRHVTLMDGFHDSKEYEVVISIPDNTVKEIRKQLTVRQQGQETNIPDAVWQNPSP